MVLFGHTACRFLEFVVHDQINCVWAKVVVFGKLVVFGHNWLY